MEGIPQLGMFAIGRSGKYTEKARLMKTCQSSVGIAKFQVGQTVGYNTREGGYQSMGKLNMHGAVFARDWVTGRSSEFPSTEGSMYSPAQVRLSMTGCCTSFPACSPKLGSL